MAPDEDITSSPYDRRGGYPPKTRSRLGELSSKAMIPHSQCPIIETLRKKPVSVFMSAQSRDSLSE